MIASLPMYARPELREAHDTFWELLRDALRSSGISAPEVLDHEINVWDAWESPKLCFSQTCNFPYRAKLHSKVTLIGAANYGLEDAAPGYYYSVFVVRRSDALKAPEDFADARFVFNEALSQSGWAAPQLWAEKRGFSFRPHIKSGAHIASARAVADHKADIAALDAVSWRLLRKLEDFTKDLSVIGRTDHTPALSFITRSGEDPEPYRVAFTKSLLELPNIHKTALGLCGIVAIPEAEYLALPTPEAPII